jgi:Lon protease-like protein
MKELFPAGKLESVPVFPLPDYVLFPNTLIPFHIFEPRYRRMAADCLGGSRLLLVAGLAPGWENDYYGTPSVHPIGGLGKVMNERRLEDGRYLLFVHGVARVRIDSFRQNEPYRVADVTVLPDVQSVTDGDETSTADLLRNLALQLAMQFGNHGADLTKVLASTTTLSALTNRLGSLLVTDAASRQSLLEERSPLGRAHALIASFSQRLLEQSHQGTGGRGTPSALLN